MRVSVAYAHADEPIWLKLDVPEGSTVGTVITASGILTRCPKIDLDRQAVGIFGRAAKLDDLVQAGDRVEIYTEISPAAAVLLD